MSSEAYAVIIPLSLLLGVVAGFIMHRSDYCLAGMFRDFFLFRQTFMLRQFGLLAVTSMVLFEGARHMGLLPLYPFPLFGSPSLANVAGGVAFGMGMVLAGGCVVGTLYKMGSGSFLSVLAFVGLIAGSTLYAEIHPWWSSFAQATTFFRGKVTVPQMLGVSPTPAVAGLGVGALYFFRRWWREGKWRRHSRAEGYLQPWQASLSLAVIGLLSSVLVGMPLGITTAYAKMGAYLESMAFRDHVQGLSYFQVPSLDYTFPITGERLMGGAGPSLDAIGAIQFPLIFGIICGGTVSALLLGEFKTYVRVPCRQQISAFSGGVIMGMASRMASGCNVWHLFGGVPIFAVQSLLFLLGLLPGAWLGSRILVRWVVKP